MNPRSFLNFLHTRSGKLAVFGLLFAAFLLLVARTPKDKGDEMAPLERQVATNRSQVVETVQRAFQVFRPPPPKPAPRPQPVASNAPLAVAEKREVPAPPPLPISLVPESPQAIIQAKPVPDVYAPFGRLIPAETVITVDSSSMRTPIVGLITEDVYHAGKLVIPAGTEVHGSAQSDRIRERLASGTSWTLVWQSGEELRLSAIALDREYASDLTQSGWGITDGSAGLRGRLIKSDDLAEIKLFAATILSGAANALTEKEQTIFGTVDSRSLNNAPFKGADRVLSMYAQRVYDAIQRDGFYVRVPAGKQFYLYVLQTIDRSDATVGGAGIPFGGTNLWAEGPAKTSSELAAPAPQE
jgi:hypothetical protein